MILTFKIKHNLDLSSHLDRAVKVARFAIANRDKLSSAHVSHIGLPSAISNQILRKYGRNRKCKSPKNVVLTVPNQSIYCLQDQRMLRIHCLGWETHYRFRNDFTKINQIELSEKYAFVSVTIKEPESIEVDGFIGVDLNTTGHSAVAGSPKTGKIIKLGKSESHIRNKYRNIRKRIQKSQELKNMKKIKQRERRKINDLNHKISRKIVTTAVESNQGIALEDLGEIRKNKKNTRKFRGALNNWSFFDLRQKIEYKARLLGIPVVLINPAYTSQTCSRCGTIGKRKNKKFMCHTCGHVDHADVNASFNIGLIASRQKEMSRTGTLISRWDVSPLEPHGL